MVVGPIVVGMEVIEVVSDRDRDGWFIPRRLHVLLQRVHEKVHAEVRIAEGIKLLGM